MSGEPVVTIVGNLAAEPSLKFLPSGVAVCNFTVACTPRVKEKGSDTWTDGETMWVRCAAWRELGEHLGESLDKGSRVIVQGRMKVRSYDQDGQQRTSIEMDVDAAGPELRYATASVAKASRGSGETHGRSGSSSAPSSDPWGDVPPPDSEAPF